MNQADPHWRSLHDGLRRFVFSRVRDATLADDLLQDTLLRLHTRRDRIDEERLMAYAYRIANSVIVDHFRARPSDVSYRDDLGPNGTGIEGQPLEQDQARVILGTWLAHQIGGLPPRYREVLERVELAGETQREVAEALGLSYSTVKSRVQRGRDLLHAKLTACCSVEVDGRGRVTDFARRADFARGADEGCADPCSSDCSEVCGPAASSKT